MFSFNSCKRSRNDSECNDSKDFHNVNTDAVNCYKSANCIYFCDQITWNSVYVLNKMLRQLEDEMIIDIKKHKSLLPQDTKLCSVKIEPIPILLF